MTSKYAGSCKSCSKPYKAGDDIYWTKSDGAHHPECWAAKNSNLFDVNEAVALADRLGWIGPDEPIPARWNVR